MAKMTSHLFSTMVGKVAGIVYFANQWHQINARAATHPVNPNTLYQTMVRGYAAYCIGAWEGLTDAQRDDWGVYGDSLVPKLTGRAAFIGAIAFVQNSARITPPIGITISTAAPTIYGGAEMSIIGPFFIPGPPSAGMRLNISNPQNEKLLVIAWRSRPFNASRMRYKGPWIPSDVRGVLCPANSGGNFIDFPGVVMPATYFTYCRGVTASLTPSIPHRTTVGMTSRGYIKVP